MTGEDVELTTISQNPLAEREQHWKHSWEAYRTAKPEPPPGCTYGRISEEESQDPQKIGTGTKLASYTDPYGKHRLR